MKRLFTAAAIIASACSANAFPATANLVGQSLGNSVTGQQIRICVYQYNGSHFQQVLPISATCPFSIQVQ